MTQTTKKQIALWLAVAIKLGFALYSGGAFANNGDVGKFEIPEQSGAVGGSLAYDNDLITVEDFAKWAKLSLGQAKAKAGAEPYLLQKDAVESVGGFNPYTCKRCDVKTLDELEDGRFTDDQAWKWFRYRREEIGACFEDEEFNEAAQKCELIDEFNK